MSGVKPMDELLSLKPGDRVRVRRDDGTEVNYTVKYEPWRLGHGTWVIGLKGISGGYDLSRVVEVLERRVVEVLERSNARTVLANAEGKFPDEVKS